MSDIKIKIFISVLYLFIIGETAQAHVPPYTWCYGSYNGSPNCQSENLTWCCNSPQETCQSLVDSSVGETISALYPRVDRQDWVCTIHSPTSDYTRALYPQCPAGYTTNMFVFGGCAPSESVLPKIIGRPGCGNIQVGNPITVCSGNKYEQVVDYSSGGTNVLDFIRHYNSASQLISSMGFGWRHNWDRKMIVTNFHRQAYVTRDDGQELYFTGQGSSFSTPDRDVTLFAQRAGAFNTLTDLRGTVERYDDATGRLVSITRANGYVQTLTYNPAGLLTQVNDNENRTLTFTYNPQSLLNSMTDPDGNVYQYSYEFVYPNYQSSTTRHLTAVTLPGSSQLSMAYVYDDPNNPSLLTGIVDQLGHRFASWNYDSDGRAIVSKHANNIEMTTIQYNADGTKTVTMPLGEQRKYTFATVQNAPKITREARLASPGIPAALRDFTYDTNGFVDSSTDWNGTLTRYVNNTRGLQTSRIEAFGTALAATTTTTWHASLDLPLQIVAPRKTTTFTYDGAGNLLTRTETDTTTHSVPYSTSGRTRAWTYTYDNHGRRTSERGPRTDVNATTTYSYDTRGNVATFTNPLNHIIRFENYNGRGFPTRITDENGVVTTLSYNRFGQVLTQTVAESSTITFGYNDLGLVTSITLPDNSVLTYTYDDARQVISVSNNSGERIDYTRDSAGNIIQQNILSSGGNLENIHRRVFDSIGRLLKEIGASSQTVTYGYDSQGNMRTIRDALNNLTSNAFDALNRMVSSTDALNKVTLYGFNSQNDPTTITDPRNLTTTYVYDGFGQVIQETSLDRGVTVYHLDEAGNRIQETDARGVIINRSFDALNRIITETFPASPGENIAYHYDETTSGNKGIGRLTSFTDESGASNFIYDDQGNTLRATHQIRGAGPYTSLSNLYTYDLANHLTSITYPSGRVVLYTRDAQGHIEAVYTKEDSLAQTVTLATNITYKPFGPLTSLMYGNGVMRTHVHDQDYRLTDIMTESGNTTIQNLRFTYNAIDNLTSILDSYQPSRSQNFLYDPLARIKHASGEYGTVDYSYDGNGNRLTRSFNGMVQTYTYPANSNRLSSVADNQGTRTLTYTESGNLAFDSRGSLSDVELSYSNRGSFKKLRKTSNNTSMTFTYNALGQRVAKLAPSSGASGAGPLVKAAIFGTYYQYDEAGRLIEIIDGLTGKPQSMLIWLDNMPLAQISNSGSIAYIHPDHLNTPQKLTNASKTVVWDRTQQPFGEQGGISSGSIRNDLRFPGQLFDPESELNYNGLRDYDPSLGRYIQADPLGMEGTSSADINLYGYAGENPIRFIDPRGDQLVQFGAFSSGIAACLADPPCAMALRFAGKLALDQFRHMMSDRPADKDKSNVCPVPANDNVKGEDLDEDDPDDDDICRELHSELKIEFVGISLTASNHPNAPGIIGTMRDYDRVARSYNKQCVPLGHPRLPLFYER